MTSWMTRISFVYFSHKHSYYAVRRRRFVPVNGSYDYWTQYVALDAVVWC